MKRTNFNPTALRKAVCCVCIAALSLSMLSGCGEKKDEPKSLLEAVENVHSVETSISLSLHGSFNGSGTYGSNATHTASMESEISISSILSPTPAYHAEYYSRMLVDGATTREDRELYVVPEGNEYTTYEYLTSSDEWQRKVMTRSDSLAILRKTGFVYDWEEFMEYLSHTDTEKTANGESIEIYTGYVPNNILQEFFGNNIFGSFMQSVQHLLKDEIPCTLKVNAETYLPEELEFDFHGDWRVTDMQFNTAVINVYYSNWNDVEEISVPKKVTVVATDPEKEFYSSYYAWNLFLPYIGGQIDGEGSAGNAGQSFASSWNTFQVRIDGGMTNIPLPYNDLQKIGYDIDAQFSSVIVEPNKYKENIAVKKGTDTLYCTFYNDDTVPQPITNCKIGCVDLSASDVPQNGIVIYLPGEVTLGITKEALISAYGDPTETITAFSCDTLIWRGDNEMQSFMAEISPVTGQVIRTQIKNIPVTGGKQI